MTKTITIHDELSIKWINQKAKQLNVNLEDLIVSSIMILIHWQEHGAEKRRMNFSRQLTSSIRSMKAYGSR